MRVLAIVIALGLGASAYAKDPSTTQPNARGAAPKAVAPASAAFNPSTAIDFFAVEGVVWARAADGRTFQWRGGSWAQGDVPQVITAYKPIIPQPARVSSNPARRFSRDPNAIITYPSGPSENVGANDPPMAGGRGRFSD